MKIENVIGNESAQEGGEWIEYKPGVEFLLVHSSKGKPRDFFQKGLSKLRRKHRGDVPFDKQQLLTLEMLILFVVKGWKGWTQTDPNDDTKEIEFPWSLANCRKLLTDSTVIRDFVAEESGDIENFGGKLDDDADAKEGTPNGAMKSRPSVES